MKQVRILLAIITLFAFAGCPTNQNISEKKVVKIGVLYSQTGDIAPYGEKALEGFNLAKENIKEDNFRIEWIVEDAKSSPKDAVSAIQKLITVDKVQAVVGPESSGLALAVAPVANENKVVLFAPTISSDKYSTPNDYTFRNWASSKLIAEKAAETTFKLGYRNVAVLNINNEMGVSYANAFKSKFELLGGKIVLFDNYAPNQTNFSSQILSVKNSKADALYLLGQVEMGQILKQMKEQGIQLPIISGIAIEDPKVAEVAGDAVNGIIYTTPSYNPNSQLDVVKNYESMFEKKYNKQSEIFAASTYDAVMILGKVISENNQTSEQIKNALFNVKNYDGVSGRISFDENGDVIKDISVKKIVDGKFVFLDDNLQVVQ